MSNEETVRRVVAMGGGGFLMETGRSLLDDHILSLTGKERPRVCFLGTASGDHDGVIARFHLAFQERDAEAHHLRLFGAPRTDLGEFVLSQDVVYVGGGNTANMLAIWRVHGMDEILREAWRRGIVMAGVSAGMICWFEASVTDSFGPVAPLGDGLGILPGSACPHFDGEADRRPMYHRLVGSGFPAGYAADDFAALVYRGTELEECVSSRPDRACYRISLRDDGVHEERLPTRYLGG